MTRNNDSRIRLMFVLILGVLFAFSVTGCAAPATEDEAVIRQAVNNLLSTESGVKASALEVLRTYGDEAVSLYVKIMQENKYLSSFVDYELVIYAEELGEAGLPIIAKGLESTTETTRRRSARAAMSLGAKAAPIVNEIAHVAAALNEASDIRSQAVDALRAIKVVNPEVERAIALALSGDPMMSWKVVQTMMTLGLTYDDTIPILFTELEDNVYSVGIQKAIATNLKNTSDPVGLLRTAFAGADGDLIPKLFDITGELYSGIKADKVEELTVFLFELVAAKDPIIRERSIYLLGEFAAQNEIIVTNLISLLSSDVADDVYLYTMYALEKTSSDNPELVKIFVDTLIDPKSTVELELIAARYLEKCSENVYPQVLVLFDHLEQIDSAAVRRLAPMFYWMAKAEPAVLAEINALTKSDNVELQAYAYGIMQALGEVVASIDTLKVETGLNQGETPAFPTAEGYGRYTVGGRGGQVYVVTNLNDRGAGSLREALDASGPRTVIFAVSGTIMLSESLNISNPYITIAGQTAPGEGITIAGAPININASQVIIRYVRIRMGDYNGIEADSIGGRYMSDVVLDHISASWSTDECVSFYEVDRVTVQWSYITESLRASVHIKGNHGYGGIWGGFASFHHNLLAHHSSRNPRFDAERTTDDPATDMRNNVLYNWGFNSTYGGEGGNHNMIANYYKPGPGTGRGIVQHRIVEVSNGGKWYIADNVMVGNQKVTDDNWAGGVQPRVGTIEQVKAHTEFPVPYVETHTAEEAYELVLEHAGASLPARDAIDIRITEEVRTGTATYGGASSGKGTGLIDNQDDVGGLPFIRGYSATLDSDQDGIPDWWAIKYGIKPVGGIDPAGDIDSDGYTNLEEYLNNTNPLKADQY